MESPWKKFLHTVLKNEYEQLLSTYYNLRKMFQNSNIENWQLEKGQGLDKFMYLERDLFIKRLSNITNTLEKYGLLGDDRQDFINYIQDKLRIIDNETPLKD